MKRHNPVLALMSLIIATPLLAETSVTWPAMVPGFSERPQEVQRAIILRVEQRFDEADTDGNGRISREELVAKWPRLAEWPKLAEYFKKVDENGDGLTLEEVIAAVENDTFADLRRSRWR